MSFFNIINVKVNHAVFLLYLARMYYEQILKKTLPTIAESIYDAEKPLERITGFEPATSTLARSRSTK